MYRLVADGELPLPESTHYPLGDAATAVRVMSAAEHTGKLVLDVPQAGHTNVVVPPEQARVFRHDGSYIVTGGLGGLGLFLAEKMAAAGCGRIVLSSRSQPNPKALETIELIRAMGTDIEVECGDITEVGTAARLVAVATATGLPLRGVLHAAAVFENAMLANMTDELDRPQLGSKGVRRVELTPGHGHVAPGLVLLVLLGGRLWWARPAKGRTPRPTAGWTHSRGGGELRAFPPRRSGGHCGPRSVAPPNSEPRPAKTWLSGRTAKAPPSRTGVTPLSLPTRAPTRSRHCCATTAPYSGYAKMTGTPWFAAYAQRSQVR